MTEILLVRHARTNWSGRRYCGTTDVPLDAAGRRDAARLAERIAAAVEGRPRIVTSPRQRATDTARVIAAATGAAGPTIDPRWAEADMGEVEGLTFDEVAGRWPELGARLAAGELDVAWPGGEAAGSVPARVRLAFADAALHDGVTIVVSHAGPIRIAVSLAIGPSTTPSLPSPAGVVRLARSPGGDRPWTLETMPD